MATVRTLNIAAATDIRSATGQAGEMGGGFSFYVDDGDSSNEGAWYGFGCRFEGIDLSDINTLTSAVITFRNIANDNNGSEGRIEVRVEDSNDPADWDTGANQPQDRLGSTLTPGVEYDAPSSGTTRTIDVTDLVQALLDKSYTYDGTAGNHVIHFLFGADEWWGTGNVVSWRSMARDWNSNPTDYELKITYEEGSGAQSITPSGISSGEAFGDATVAKVAAQNVVPAGIAGGEAFGDAAITLVSAQSIAAEGISSAEAFGDASISAVVNTVTPSGIPSDEAFGDATVANVAAATVTPGGITSGEAFGDATIANASPQTVSPGGVASGEAFGNHTIEILATGTLLPAGVASGEAFGDATVANVAAETVTPSSIDSAEAFGDSTLSNVAATTVSPDGIASGETFGDASIGEPPEPAEMTAGAVIGSGFFTFGGPPP